MKKNIDKLSPIFVVGFPRSGTTFLSELFNRHSNISIPSETRFFREFYLQSKSLTLRYASCEEKVKHFLENRWIADIPVTDVELLEELSGNECEYSNIFIALLKANAKKNKKSRYGEKTPIHLMYVDEILRLYPSAKIICIVRDCRDAVLSIMDTPWRKGHFLRYAADWRYRAALSLKYSARYPDSFRVVRFEDLVTKPKETLEELCEFIGEKFENGQLNPSKSKSIVPEWEQRWKSKALEKVDISRICVWQHHKDQRIVQFVGCLVKDDLKKLGYRVESAKFRGSDRIMMWAYFAIYNPYLYWLAHKFRDVFREFYYIAGIRNLFYRRDIIDKLRRH